MYFKAFNVLTADVENKIDVGFEMPCRSKMRYCFDNTLVGVKSVLYKFLAVACDRRAENVYFVRAHFAYFYKFLQNKRHGIALV